MRGDAGVLVLAVAGGTVATVAVVVVEVELSTATTEEGVFDAKNEGDCLLGVFWIGLVSGDGMIDCVTGETGFVLILIRTG